MAERQVATIDIVKALAGVPLTVFAAVGSASSNLLFTGLAALPLAVLVAYDTLGKSLQAGKLKIQEEKPLEISAPFGWRSDIPSWKSLCAEIELLLPNILQRLEQLLKQKRGQVTQQTIQQAFTDALADELRHTWLPTYDEHRLVARYLTLSILPTMNQVIAPLIEQMRKEADSSNLHDIRDDIREMHDTLVPPRLRDEDMVRLRQQYFDVLCQQKMLDFKGISYAGTTRPVSIPLPEVFVLPEVLVGIPEYETIEREDRQELDKEGKQERHWEEEQERLRRRDRTYSKYKRIAVQREDLRPVLTKHRRLVILGDPGAGKSTLLRYLMLALAEKDKSFIKEFPQLTPEALVASPLYISLATYAGAWQDSEVGEKSLIDFLPRYLRDRYLGDYIHLLFEQLQQGTLLLLFDGLDEIPNAALRMQIVRQIEAFTQAYPKNRFIVTSRIVGYREAPHQVIGWNSSTSVP